MMIIFSFCIPQKMTRVQIKKICDTLDLKYVRKLETKKTVDYYTNLLINILMRESDALSR